MSCYKKSNGSFAKVLSSLSGQFICIAAVAYYVAFALIKNISAIRCAHFRQWQNILFSIE